MTPPLHISVLFSATLLALGAEGCTGHISDAGGPPPPPDTEAQQVPLSPTPIESSGFCTDLLADDRLLEEATGLGADLRLRAGRGGLAIADGESLALVGEASDRGVVAGDRGGSELGGCEAAGGGGGERARRRARLRGRLVGAPEQPETQTEREHAPAAHRCDPTPH